MAALDERRRALGLSLRWLAALGVMVVLAVASYLALAHRLAALGTDAATISLAGRQTMLLQWSGSLARLLADTHDVDERVTLRQELARTADMMEEAHEHLRDRARTPDMRAVFFEPPLALDGRIRDLVRQLRALAEIEDPVAARRILEASRSGAVVGGLSAALEGFRREHEAALRTTRMVGLGLLSAYVLVAVLIGVGIGTPMVRRVHREIARRDQANRLLAERTNEVERSRAAALSMMEDAELARLEAECAKEAAWTLVAIVRSSGDGILGLAPDGTITSWNAGAERLYGYGAEEILGKPLGMLVPPAHAAEAAALLGAIAGGQDVARSETERLRKDGTTVQVSVTVSAIKDAAGRLIGVSSIDRDVSEQRRAEEALARQAAALSRSNRELEQFAYVASHDLQEPLRMVGSYVQLISRRYKGRLDADADEFIEYAVAGARRMQTLINDLLSFSRLGSRGKTLAEVDCAAALAAALANLGVALAETAATVTHDPLPRLIADRSLLIQLFQNLVGNAVKFHGERPPKVHVRATREGAEWLFTVADNGIGLDPRHGERIFQIFQRLHTRDRYPGTGIGLAQCRKIVECHGGRIWVESSPGAGSTFLFTISAGLRPDAPADGPGEARPS